MAKVNFGGGVTDMRGKLAGNAFSRNKSGAYVRAKVTGTNPSTDKQTAVRSLFGGLSAGWRTLTEVERASFIEQAPAYPKTDIFGNAVQYSGQQLYMHLNQQLLATGNSSITSCPPPVDVVPVTIVEADLDPSTPAFNLNTVSTPEAGTQLVIEATAPMSGGVSNAGTKYRQIAVAPTISGGNINLQPAYDAVFSPVADIPSGSKVFIRWFVVSQANGQTSAYGSLTAIAQ